MSIKNLGLVIISIVMIIFFQSIFSEKVFPEDWQSPYYYNTEDEKKDFKDAYTFINKENPTAAIKLINKWKTTGGYKVGWNILWAWVLMVQDKDYEALELIESIRPSLEKNFKMVANAKIEEYSNASIEGIKFLYYNMLFVSGESNYQLKNYRLALKDFLDIIKQYNENDVGSLFAKSSYLYRIGACYYQLEKYNNSLSYLKKSYLIAVELKEKIPKKEGINIIYENLNLISLSYYQLGEIKAALEYMKKAYYAIEMEKDDIRKQRAAYNVGGIYSILGDVDNAIKWLKIPLRINKSLWLEKINKDKDFDKIRNSRKFQDFVEKS